MLGLILVTLLCSMLDTVLPQPRTPTALVCVSCRFCLIVSQRRGLACDRVLRILSMIIESLYPCR